MFKQKIKPYKVGWTTILGNLPQVKYFDDRSKARKFWKGKKAWAGITIKNVWMSCK